jgi:tetrahydromethanopterin S-methyltransferase subunit F
MLNLKHWQVAPALVVTLGITTSAIAPFSTVAPAVANSSYTVAQLFPSPQTQYQRLAIPAGTTIPVRYTSAEKIVVLPTETTPLTLTVARNIRSTNGTLLIPSGSEIKGNLRPSQGGSQFVAQELVLTDGTVLPINARSQVVTRTERIRRGVNSDAILKGTAIGAGAATLISGLAGNRRITIGKVLAGAGAGALGGLLFGRREVEVISIYPDTDLNLTLASSLALR